MSGLNRQQRVLLPHLGRLIGRPSGGDVADGELLGRFLRERDPAAFEVLVRRHGPTVLGVCRRVLANAHDAEDAFQATFLVLVRRARSIARHEALGSWLHGVAYRVALKARAAAGRRRRHERQAAEQTAEGSYRDGAGDDLAPVIDEEVSRLPAKYRAPIVLCYFEGKTYQEAARLLGWPAGTASVRLARARALLRSRLTRRGLAPAAGVLAVRLAEGTAPAAEVGLLAAATARAAADVTAGSAASISANVLALTQGVVQAMLVQKLKVLAGTVVAVALACGGARGLWHVAAPAAAAEQPAGVPAADPAPAAGDRPTADLTEPEVGAPTGSPPRALATPGARPTRTRIGLINMTRVLKASTRFQAAQADVRKRVRQLQRQVEDLRTQVEKLQAQSTNPGTTAERREEVSEELAKLRRRIEEEQQAAQAKVTRTGSDALARTYREIEDVANRYAKAYDLDLVLFYTDAVTEADFYKPATLERKLTQPGALMPLVAAPGMDITDAVIRMLNRAHAPARTPEGTP